MNPVHDTLQFSRTIDASVDRVWAAYAEVEHRRQWSVPDGEDVVYDTANFTVGGEDNYRCGPPGRLDIAGTHLYHLIEPRRRFLYIG